MLHSLRELAEQAARVGGVIARDAFRGNQAVRLKADGSEVSDADEAAQFAVIEHILAHRPDDAILAEEGDAADASARRTPPSDGVLSWIIDPIDGTRNYVRGIPIYAVSVGVMHGGSPLAGAVFLPERDELYSANGVAGLLLNGQSPPPTPYATEARRAQRKPLAGVPSSWHGAAEGFVREWVSRVKVRNLGSIAVHLAMVAAGQMEAALMSDSRLWDIAAGWLLIKSTGGMMTTLDGEEVFPFDVGKYAGEPIPCLASCDAETHARLLAGNSTQ